MLTVVDNEGWEVLVSFKSLNIWHFIPIFQQKVFRSPLDSLYTVFFSEICLARQHIGKMIIKLLYRKTTLEMRWYYCHVKCFFPTGFPSARTAVVLATHVTGGCWVNYCPITVQVGGDYLNAGAEKNTPLTISIGSTPTSAGSLNLRRVCLSNTGYINVGKLSGQSWINMTQFHRRQSGLWLQKRKVEFGFRDWDVTMSRWGEPED